SLTTLITASGRTSSSTFTCSWKRVRMPLPRQPAPFSVDPTVRIAMSSTTTIPCRCGQCRLLLPRAALWLSRRACKEGTRLSPMDRRSCRLGARWLRKPLPVRISKPQATSDRRHEYLAAIHSSAHRHVFVDDGAVAGRYRCLQAIADFGAAAGGLSDDTGSDVLPRGKPRRHCVFDYSAAGTAVRRAPRPQPDDFQQFLRGIRHHAAVHSGREH